MTQNRRTPFGYRITQGRVSINEKEAAIVREIFRRYRQGDGYQEIASRLSAGPVPYFRGPLWNKHMVKRILENERLTGTEDYPPILSEEAFREAAVLREAKTADYDKTSPLIQAIRRKMVCAACGSQVLRHTKHKGRPRWECPSRCRLEIRESELIGQVIRLLNLAAALPPLRSEGAELNVLRLRRELNREWDKAERDEESLRKGIFRLAAAQYALCPPPQEPEPVTERNCLEALRRLAGKLLLSPDGTLTLETRDGRRVSLNEKGADNP